MDKEKFVELLTAEQLSKDDLTQIDHLIKKYPWFSLPKFLRLKAAHQNNLTPETDELVKAVIYSSDRKHLYNWIHEELRFTDELTSLSKSEIEFLDLHDSSVGEEVSPGDTFELMEEDIEGELDETEVQAIVDKEETEMEDPEIDDSNVVPVIDNLEEDSDQRVSEETIITEVEAEIKELELPTAGTVIREDSLRNPSITPSVNKTNKSAGLIESFLQSDPGVIKADKETSLEGDVSKESVMEDDSFITDTLAKIYVKQGLHAKAIYAYERLSLKYPEKSAYFAAQIEKIKNVSNL